MANERLIFLHATFTVFWLNIAFIAVHSGERCGPWTSGLKLATNGQSDKAFLLTSGFCPQRVVCPGFFLRYHRGRKQAPFPMENTLIFSQSEHRFFQPDRTSKNEILSSTNFQYFFNVSLLKQDRDLYNDTNTNSYSFNDYLELNQRKYNSSLFVWFFF